MVSPDDYIPCDLFMGIGNIVQYRLAERNAKHHRWYDKIELSTEPRKSLGMWLREIYSCSCLTFLPGSAWMLLGKICKDFFSPLYLYLLPPKNEINRHRIFTLNTITLKEM